MREIKIFCPATIANLSCGFDVLGLCLATAGDEMIIRKSDVKGVRITKIVGADLPLETEKNVAGVAALAMLKSIKKVKLKPSVNIFLKTIEILKIKQSGCVFF